MTIAVVVCLAVAAAWVVPRMRAHHQATPASGAALRVAPSPDASSEPSTAAASTVPTTTPPSTVPTATPTSESAPSGARPGALPGDQLVPVGSPVTVDGLTGTEHGASFVPVLSSFESDGYLVVEVVEANEGAAQLSFGPLDWQLQYPDGHVESPMLSSAPNQLPSGSLVPGGHAEGSVVFKVGATRGAFYVLFGSPFNIPGLSDGATHGAWVVIR